MSKVIEESEADQARIDAEAADWLVRHDDGALAQQERAAFDAWAASDPRRSRTFAAMSRTWREAANLKHLAHLAEAAPPRRASRAFRSVTPSLPSLRALALATAAVAVLAFIGSFMMEFLEGHATGVGQTRVLTLSDGSTVVLGARSRVVVRFTQRERLVRLTAGEALFEVRHNAARPFVVDAGDTVIRDVGTRFDVNRAGASVRVAVLEGEVEVRESGAPAAHLVESGASSPGRRQPRGDSGAGRGSPPAAGQLHRASSRARCGNRLARWASGLRECTTDRRGCGREPVLRPRRDPRSRLREPAGDRLFPDERDPCFPEHAGFGAAGEDREGRQRSLRREPALKIR